VIARIALVLGLGARAPLAAPTEAQRLLDGPDGEPTVHELMAAAEREAELRPERLRSWMSRARLAALSPRVSFGIDRSFGRDESLDLTGGGRDISTDDDLGWKAEASWDLSRLVFSPDEMRVAREGLRLVELRREVLSRVVRIYFERRRLLAQRVMAQRAGPLDAAADLDREVRIREIEGELDALCGGAMSRGLGRAP
jgi:hypothetical protein